MSTALSEKEQKMTLEDFKRVFQGVFLQNDTEKTVNVAALLNKSQEEYSIRGGKMMKKKNKTKKRKIKKINKIKYKKKSKKNRK
jgi:hypothetical protein